MQMFAYSSRTRRLARNARWKRGWHTTGRFARPQSASRAYFHMSLPKEMDQEDDVSKSKKVSYDSFFMFFFFFFLD